MRVETLTFVYNEEFLLPFYLKHYDFVDRMNIAFDISSTDRTLEILKANDKVNLIPVNFPGKWNSLIKQLMLHDMYDCFDSDIWILNVDCDEFIFIDKFPTDYLINSVAFFNVFRNEEEKDLDINLPVKDQRRHGFLNHMYIKPILTLSGLNLKWTPGCHLLTDETLENYKIVNSNIPVHSIGAHWENADPCFCVERRCRNRRDRQSKYNMSNQYGVQNHSVTEESVLAYCKKHEQDPKLW